MDPADPQLPLSMEFSRGGLEGSPYMTPRGGGAGSPPPKGGKGGKGGAGKGRGGGADDGDSDQEPGDRPGQRGRHSVAAGESRGCGTGRPALPKLV